MAKDCPRTLQKAPRSHFGAILEHWDGLLKGFWAFVIRSRVLQEAPQTLQQQFCDDLSDLRMISVFFEVAFSIILGCVGDELRMSRGIF